MMRAYVFRGISWCSLGILFCIATLDLLSPSRASASVLVVKNGVADSSKGTLAYILNRISEGDTIKFDVAERDTLRLGSEIVITKGISLLGRNAATGNRICIIGNPRVFILSGGAFNLTDMALLGDYYQPGQDYDGGVVKISGPGTRVNMDSVDVMYGMAWARGAGILNEYATVHIAHAKIASNTFGYSSNDGEGGGIYNLQGRITVSHSILSANRSSEGGGIFNDQGFVAIDGTVITDNHLFSGGSSAGYSAGGGIYNSGRMSIANSTISDNVAEAKVTWTVFNGDAYAYGGGIYNEGIVSLSNCTISGNSAPASTVANNANAYQEGGGISNRNKGIVYLANSTIAFNDQDGIRTDGGTAFAINTIISGNKGYGWKGQRRGLGNLLDTCDFCSAADSGFAITGSNSAKIFGDPKAMLGENGGPTQTIPLSSACLAVGRGLRAGPISWDTLSDTLFKPVYFSDSKWYQVDARQPVPAGVKVAELELDQRGIKRGDPPSIGAYEYNGPAVGVHPSYHGSNDGSAGLISLRALGKNILLIEAPAPENYSFGVFTIKGEAVMKLKLEMKRPSRKLVLPKDLLPGEYLVNINNPKLSRSIHLVIP